MADIQFRIDISKAIREFKVLPKKLIKALTVAANDSGVEVLREARRRAPVFTGRLRGSIFNTTRFIRGNPTAIVGSNLPYARHIELGQKKGWTPNIDNLKVYARRKLGDEGAYWGMLVRFQNKKFKRKPFLKPALKAKLSTIKSIYADRLREFLRKK